MADWVRPAGEEIEDLPLRKNNESIHRRRLSADLSREAADLPSERWGGRQHFIGPRDGDPVVRSVLEGTTHVRDNGEERNAPSESCAETAADLHARSKARGEPQQTGCGDEGEKKGGCNVTRVADVEEPAMEEQEAEKSKGGEGGGPGTTLTAKSRDQRDQADKRSRTEKEGSRGSAQGCKKEKEEQNRSQGAQPLDDPPPLEGVERNDLREKKNHKPLGGGVEEQGESCSPAGEARNPRGRSRFHRNPNQQNRSVVKDGLRSTQSDEKENHRTKRKECRGDEKKGFEKKVAAAPAQESREQDRSECGKPPFRAAEARQGRAEARAR